MMRDAIKGHAATVPAVPFHLRITKVHILGPIIPGKWLGWDGREWVDGAA
jgi:hypothetical protein